jgi:SAM-dependent methyltransferase
LKEIPVSIKLTHPNDLDLQVRMGWFMEQPGCLFQTGEPHSLPILNLTRKGTFLDDGQSRLAFHPNLAIIRILQGLRGEQDRFLAATNLKSGQTFLDATLGLGTDALVAAWQVGRSGKVMAFENSPLLAALMKEGLHSLKAKQLPTITNPNKQKAWQELILASQRIEVIWGDHQSLLAELPDSSFDVIYFDPMFRHTREKSSSIQPLHRYSDHRPLQAETIKEACRVACSRVVLKERKGSSEFARLGFEVINSGRYSQVDYGIINCCSTKEDIF